MTTNEPARQIDQVPLRGDRLGWLWGAAVFALHALLAGRYDLFRDELYFIVCGQHPAFGYVDQPPLVPLLAAGLYALGHGAWAVRLPAALAAGVLVVVTIRLVRLLKGERIAVLLAALAVSIAPLLMGMSSVLSTTTFEPLAWTAIALLLVRASRLGDDRALILAGLVAGIALEVKYSLALWAVGVAVGVLATEQRGLLLRRALWVGLALAGLIALPSVIWQARHGIPFLELSAAAAAKNADVALAPFVLNQIMLLNPFLAPLWLAGLIAPFFVRKLRDLKFLPIAWVVFFVIVRLGHGKDYYLAATYPALFAIGAVALAPLCRGPMRRAGFAVVALAAFAVSAIAAPIALPLLSPAALASYIRATGLAPQQQEKNFAGTALPQLFADQLGWHDFTAQVLAAWSRVPAADRAHTAIEVDNYGEAAALDLYGRQGLPPALSGHNQYFLWGLRGQRPVDLVVVQESVDDLRPYCREVAVLGVTHSPYAMAYENGKVIALCRGVTPPLATLWPRLKAYR